jgi:hypothetical protein
VPENRVLSIIFRPKRDQVLGGWRKLHNEELYNFYTYPNINTFTTSTCGVAELPAQPFFVLYCHFSVSSSSVTYYGYTIEIVCVGISKAVVMF